MSSYHPIKEILIENGYRLNDCGEFWKTSANYRGGNNKSSLSINKLTGYFWDFGVNLQGSAEELVQLISGKLANFKDYVAPETIYLTKMEKIYPKEILKKLLPDYGFYEKSSISLETLKTFEAGMAHSGKLNRRVCFPIYNTFGRIIGFAGRWHQKNLPENFDIPKWKLINSKKKFLYPCHLNQGEILKKKEIIIVESVGDVLALWEAGLKNSLCIFGTSISAHQINYILSLDPELIIIATNNDKEYEKGPLAAKNIKGKLDKLFNKDKIIIRLPKRNDFGDSSKEEILQWKKDSVLNI